MRFVGRIREREDKPVAIKPIEVAINGLGNHKGKKNHIT